MAKQAVKPTDQGKTAKTYVSQGTISVHFRTNLTEPHQTLHFVPGSDYSIKHRNKNFAVFVSKTPTAVPVTLQGSEPGPVQQQQEDNEPQPQPVTSQDSGAFVREYDQVKVIEVTLPNWPDNVRHTLLSYFALHQTKVEIEVTRNEATRELTLTGITVPKHAR